MKSSILIYGLGFLAQILFSARTLIQWIKSEKAKRSVSPAIYWQLSIIAAIIMFFYGWLRSDFAILLGQSITFYIYIYNLKLQDKWKGLSRIFRWMSYAIPVFILTYSLLYFDETWARLFQNKNIPLALLLWGSAGQIVFTFRFVYQGLYSHKIQQSVLSRGFWLISLTGSLMILSYAIYRLDPVLFVGNLFGASIYARNIWLSKKVKPTGF